MKGKILLTNDEWMSLIDAENGELARCCANISELRDSIITIARYGCEVIDIFAQDFLMAYRAAEDGHDLKNIPALQKLLKQVEKLFPEEAKNILHSPDNMKEVHIYSKDETVQKIEKILKELQEQLKFLK